MTRWIGLALVALGALARADDATLDIRQVDAGDFPTVRLFISLTDAAGKPLTGLTVGAIRVTESGTEVSSPRLPAGLSPPMTAFLVIDRSGSMAQEHKIDQAREAASRFVEMMRAGDRTGLISFADDVDVMQDPTDNRDFLKDHLRGIHPNGRTACFSAVAKAVDLLSGMKGRRSVIVLTDGRDNQSEQRGDTLDRVAGRAQESGVPVFTIGVGEDVDKDVLTRLARGTHGSYAFAPSAQELVGLFAREAEELQKEFVLEYTSPHPTADGQRREVSVHAAWHGKDLVGTSAYAPSGLVRVAPRAEKGSAVGYFFLIALVLAFFAAVPILLKRAAESAAVSKGAPLAPTGAPLAPEESARARVRVIAPTQVPPSPVQPGRVRIVAAADPPPPPSTPPAAPAAPSAPSAPRVRILPGADAPDVAPAPEPPLSAPPPPADAPPAP